MIWSHLTAGISHVCGLAGGKAYCFSHSGEVGGAGNALGDRQAHPIQVPGHGRWRTISSGEFHSCGIKWNRAAFWSVHF